MSAHGYGRRSLFLYTLVAMLLLAVSCSGGSDMRGPGALPLDSHSATAEFDAFQCPNGVSAQTWSELTSALAKALQAKSASMAVFRPPHSAGAASTLTFDPAGALLKWSYYSPGDYDQNGAVGLSDIVPLAVHFGETTGTGDPFPPDSIQSVIDGDANGELNLGDVGAIAANFGVRAEGYHVFGSSDTADCPVGDDPNGPGAEFIGEVAISHAQQAPGGGRLRFSHQVAVTETAQYYWVRPFEDLQDGAASNYVMVQLPQYSELPPAAVLANPPAGETPAHILWDASASHDQNTGGAIVRYEWDFDNDGVYEYDSGLTSQMDFYYYAPGDYTCAVRVTDNSGNTDTAAGTVSVTDRAAWHVNLVDELTRFVQGGARFWTPHVLDAGGKPGLIYKRNTPIPQDSLVFTGAIDEQGETWPAPLVLYTLPQSFSGITEAMILADAAVVDGHPTVVFDRKTTDESQTYPAIVTHIVYYLRADDELGGSWPQPLIINYAQYVNMTPFTPIVGTDFSVTAMLNVDGTPALLGAGPYGTGYRWVRALDSTGSAWAEPTVVGDNSTYLAGTLGDDLILTTIAGLPAKARSVSQDILYSHSENPDQPDWVPPEVIVDDHEKASSHIQLVEAAGFPAVVYYDSATDDLKCRRALNSVGSAWAAPVVVSSRAISSRFSAAVVDGRPCVIYGDRIDKTARFIAANDAAGTYWGFPMVFWGPPESGSSSDLLSFLDKCTPPEDVAGAPAFYQLNYVSDVGQFGKDQILYESYY